MSGSVLQNAVVRLLKKRPYYGLFILNLHREVSAGDRPIGVTIHEGTPTLTVNEGRFGAFAPDEQEALLEHCVRHLLHLHMVRRKGRNSHCWDICCDIAINPSIEGMPAGSPLPVDYRSEPGLAAEVYYSLLVPQFDVGNLSGYGIGSAIRDVGGKNGAGEGDAQHRSSGPVDDHACWQESDSTPVRLAEEMIRNIARDTRKRCDGEVPAEIRDLLDGLLRPTAIPWRQLLRQFVATAGRVGRKSTWLREHRRFQHDTPGTRKRHRLNLLVGVDVSDSTNIIGLRESFAKELMGIARGQDSLLTVLYANSRIQRIESLKGEGVRLESYHGGGFTDLRPVFDYARTMRPLPAAIIYLTDGYGEAPERMEFPTLWVLTADGEKPAPWGAELRLEG